MLSQLTEAMIINGAVLATVLATDLGPERKIGRMRILRPLILVASSRSSSSGRPPTARAWWWNWPASSRACSAAWPPPP